MTTAWFNKKVIPKLMVGAGFKPLNQSDHFTALQQCMEQASGKKLLDLGCGVGDVQGEFTDFEYTGADLPHVIEEAAKIKNPAGTYIHFDTNNDEYEFLGEYDVILMNSFISEIPDWFRVLSNVLFHAKRDIIIHRQELTHRPTRLEKYATYGGLETTKTIINLSQLMRIFELNRYQVICLCDSFPNNQAQKSFLLRKEKDEV